MSLHVQVTRHAALSRMASSLYAAGTVPASYDKLNFLQQLSLGKNNFT